MKKFILYLIFLPAIVSCENKKSEESTNNDDKIINNTVEIQNKIDAEKRQLEEEKLLLETKQKRFDEEKKRAENRAYENIERKFKGVNYVYVVVEKTSFYSQPNFSSKKAAYLVQFDETALLKVANGFGYVEFYNSYSNKTTKGWLSLNDLAPANMDF